MPTAAGSPTRSLPDRDLRFVAVAPAALAPELLELTGGELLEQSPGWVMVRHGVQAGLDQNFPDHETMRCLDRYDLILPFGSEARELVLAGFFGRLHSAYESEIEPTRNLENISFLLELVMTARPASHLPVLDLGCGTGLSHEVATVLGVDLLGYDICAGMRRLARDRGLRIIESDEIETWPTASLRGGFASYVLHLHHRPELLREIARCLEPGGVFAANLHKGLGQEAFASFARELGLEPTFAPSAGQDERHGLYVICSKS
jgi:SAM-dependent methyltransferase